ncbi:DUF1329 domain-containing protein [Pseudomonas aeruginosa]
MHHLDPFAADRPRLVLDSRNMAAYQALLTPGTQALLQANPDYHLAGLPHPPRRIPAERLRTLPRANASRAELIAGQRRAGRCRRRALPPPQSGKRSGTTSCATAASNCTCRPTRRRCWPTAASNLLKLDRYLYFVYGREGMIPENLDNTLFYYKYKVVAPARLAGSALVVQETLDQVLSIRKAWRFNRGERRVRRFADPAYDSLQPDTNGMATADTVDVYNGAPITTVGVARQARDAGALQQLRGAPKGLAYGDILKSRLSIPTCCATSCIAPWWSEATLRKGFQPSLRQAPLLPRRRQLANLAADIYDGRRC